MAFIPTPDGVKVCMRFVKGGQQCCNVFHVKIDVPADESVLTAIGEIFTTSWIDHLQAQTSTDTTLEAVEVTDISTAGGIGIEYATGLPQTGTLGGGIMPNNVTVATKLTTGRTGRSYRGRFYYTGISGSHLTADGQHVVAGLQPIIQAFIEQLLTNLGLNGWQLAVLSLFTGGAPRAAGVLTEVLGALVNSTLDSQRRRLPERGS